MKGTHWAISPDTKATSRESRSSLETSALHLAARAAAEAAASCGRRSRAPAPLPVLLRSIRREGSFPPPRQTWRAQRAEPGIPSPDCPCWRVDTLDKAIARRRHCSGSEIDIRNHRQMIRNLSSVAIAVHAEKRRRWTTVNAVEAKCRAKMKLLKRLRAGRRAANSFLTEPTQNQSLKSPITTVVKGTSPIKRSRASA